MRVHGADSLLPLPVGRETAALSCSESLVGETSESFLHCFRSSAQRRTAGLRASSLRVCVCCLSSSSLSVCLCV